MRADPTLRLTRTDLSLMRAVASEEDGICATKAQLASMLGRCVRTMDRSVRRLQEAGLIEVEYLTDDYGASIGNAYELAEAGRARLASARPR